MKTADALSLLSAIKERIARMYFGFFRTFRADPAAAQCWWELARDEYGHAGLLMMLRELAEPQADCGEIGGRLWALVESVERCEREAGAVTSLAGALEMAIRLESSELAALSYRIVHSLEGALPDEATRSLSAWDAHWGRLAEATNRIADPTLRQRVAAILGEAQGR